MNRIFVSELYCHPVKSCRGIALQQAVVGPMGIEHDREWMFINDKNGTFVAQRGDNKTGAVGVKSMCLIETAITANSLILTAPEMPELVIPLLDDNQILRTVTVWESHCSGTDQGEEAARWATKYLSREVPGSYRMVRALPGRKARAGEGKLGFADAYPFLILSEASLRDLNNRLNNRMKESLPVNRFRPNIVLAGCESYEEDTLPNFKIGTVNFTCMNLCVRCLITTTNQETAEQGKEPLATLSTYRRIENGNGVVLGRNVNHNGSGIISINDPLIF
jgi:uncharacterized protein YcbX